MKNLLLPIIAFIAIADAFAADCLTTREAPCEIELTRLHPTQLTLGTISLPEKIDKLEKHYRKGTLQKRLLKKAIPAVLGPDGLFYIQDGHHEMAALEFSKLIPNKEKIVIISNLLDKSNLTMTSFKNFMIRTDKVFLLDENFRMTKFEDIPRTFTSMKDNPYRSFAWLVKENGGFCKVPVNYLEFIWGKFFKDMLLKRNIVLNSNPKILHAHLPLGLEIASSHLAKELPGFKEKHARCEENEED